MSTYLFQPTDLSLPTYLSPYLPLPTYLHISRYLCISTYVYLCMYLHQHTYHHLPTDFFMSTYQHIPTYINLPSSTYLPLPIPKYHYIIAANPGASIGLVTNLRFLLNFRAPKSYPHLWNQNPESPDYTSLTFLNRIFFNFAMKIFESSA